MLLLFETAAGFALFKVNKEDKLEQANVRVQRSAFRGPAAAVLPTGADLLGTTALVFCRTLQRTSRRLTAQRR